jgi:hypothetical protein
MHTSSTLAVQWQHRSGTAATDSSLLPAGGTATEANCFSAATLSALRLHTPAALCALAASVCAAS